MCGICGIVHSDRSRSVNARTLRRMADAISRRGPDDQGFHVDHNVGLGNRRLAVIDVSGGHQPLCNEDGTIWLTYNGQVYNFQELRSQLVAQGHTFTTRTDTEVIVHLYEQHGFDAVAHLNGMFAFALWDSRKRLLWCARDRFGIKPFFYASSPESFLFGSEIKALRASGLDLGNIDRAALDHYFAYGYTGGPNTIYANVCRLPSAHYLVIEPDRSLVPTVRRYWDFEFSEEPGRKADEWREEFDATLADSVRIRMVSDVPLGAFLSGGMDSSSVVAMMARFSPTPVKTFSIGFREERFNEAEYARNVAVAFGTDHHEQILQSQSVELLSTLVDVYDEPFADSSAIPTYCVSQFARQHVTVALTGDGGDEFWAGYTVYLRWRFLSRLSIVPGFVRSVLLGPIGDLLPLFARGKGFSQTLAVDPRLLPAMGSLWSRPERSALYGDRRSQYPARDAERDREERLLRPTNQDIISRAQDIDVRHYMTDDILTKVDRASMWHSLEVRIPFLDHRLAELSCRMPLHMKVKGASQKRILRDVMAPVLPPEVMTHAKTGFAIPLHAWLRNDVREYAADRLLSPGCALSDFVDPAYVARLVAGFAKGGRDLSPRLWCLLFLDAWLTARAAPSRPASPVADGEGP